VKVTAVVMSAAVVALLATGCGGGKRSASQAAPPAGGDAGRTGRRSSRIAGPKKRRAAQGKGAIGSTTGASSVTTPASNATSPSTSLEPAPVADQGYHEVFRDDFDTLNRQVWDDHIWYDRAPNPAWTGFQNVENGVLHLRTARSFTHPGSGWPINTITTQSSGRAFTQGYFEARVKWTAARGAWPGFWLFSNRHATNSAWPSVNPYCSSHGLPSALCWSAELDVFEGQGSEPHGFYGTLHRNSCNCYGVNDAQNSNNYQPVAPDLGSDFHTYSALWTSSQITWYLDGQRLFSDPVYDSTNQPMYLLLQMWTGGWSSDPDASTPNVLETQVDYVSVWQRRG